MKRLKSGLLLLTSLTISNVVSNAAPQPETSPQSGAEVKQEDKTKANTETPAQTLPKIDVPPLANDQEIKAVSIRRTACLGTCPIDALVLHADGTATYTGENFVERVGNYRGVFPVAEFTRLAKLIKSVAFFELNNKYSILATDLPSVITTVTTDKNSKTVSDYGPVGPMALWNVQMAIRGISADIKWQRVEDNQQDKKEEVK